MPNGFISIIKKKVVTNLPFILLILILGTYLTIKAIPENSWDGWGFASAQSMLSMKQVAENGFLKSYFLYLPQGYSKTVQYIDDLPLRQHAHGTITGGLIGQRLYYAHSPPGFIIFPTLLMRFGLENRIWFRLLGILFSLTGLSFFYWFLKQISNRLMAFLATFYYAISIMFLDYANNIASLPFEELLRFSIIALSLVAFKKNNKKYFNYLIWILYFILALSSYDATFFIFAWLIGFDLIIQKKIDFKKWLFWASAPILAFGIQILQNAWYLGWHDMIKDFYGAYNTKFLGANGNLQFLQLKIKFLIFRIATLLGPFGDFFGIHWQINFLTALKLAAKYLFLTKLSMDILIMFGGILAFYFVEKIYQPVNKMIKYLILLMAASIFNFFIYPQFLSYQSRIIAPFGGLLVAGLTVMGAEILYKKHNLKLNLKIIVSLILLAALGLSLIQMTRTYDYLVHWVDTNTYPVAKMEFDKKIKNLLPGDKDKIIFQILSLKQELPPSGINPPYTRPQEKIMFYLYDNHTNIPGTDPYPQVMAEDEYYVGSPILGFVRTLDLIRDLGYLKKRSEFPFSAIILSDRKEILQEIRDGIMIKRISKNNLKIIELESDKFALIVPS